MTKGTRNQHQCDMTTLKDLFLDFLQFSAKLRYFSDLLQVFDLEIESLIRPDLTLFGAVAPTPPPPPPPLRCIITGMASGSIVLFYNDFNRWHHEYQTRY